MDNKDAPVRLGRIEEKLDKVVEHITSIDVTLAKQHVSLKEHMRRTELLEMDMRPVKAHVNAIHGVLKAIGLAATVLGALASVLKIIGLI